MWEERVGIKAVSFLLMVFKEPSGCTVVHAGSQCHSNS